MQILDRKTIAIPGPAADASPELIAAAEARAQQAAAVLVPITVAQQDIPGQVSTAVTTIAYTRAQADATFATAQDSLSGQYSPMVTPPRVQPGTAGVGWVAGATWATSDVAATDATYPGPFLHGVTTGAASPASFTKSAGLTPFDPAGKILAIPMRLSGREHLAVKSPVVV